MFYSDIRQVDQFCITNKIYGKEKEKVLKAVQTNKASLTLEWFLFYWKKNTNNFYIFCFLDLYLLWLDLWMK